MPESSAINRTWVQEVLPDQVRIRCSYRRRGKRIVQYTVQVEIQLEGDWKPVVRYDNAHGFCHRDTIHPDGSQDKTATFVGEANETFTLAIKEVQAHWLAHRDRYLGEVQT